MEWRVDLTSDGKLVPDRPLIDRPRPRIVHYIVRHSTSFVTTSFTSSWVQRRPRPACLPAEYRPSTGPNPPEGAPGGPFRGGLPRRAGESELPRRATRSGDPLSLPLRLYRPRSSSTVSANFPARRSSTRRPRVPAPVEPKGKSLSGCPTTLSSASTARHSGGWPSSSVGRGPDERVYGVRGRIST